MFSLKSSKSIGLAIGTIALTLSVATMAQASVDKVDDGDLVKLTGNVSPAATAKNDRGPVDPATRLDHMVVVLQRSPEQEAALRQLIEMQQASGSAFYHQWLAPAEFGKTFGASDKDIAAVSAWLTGQGFQINEVRGNHLAIDISGTAAQVRQAFHTEIHELNVAGVTHFANISDPQIPASLSHVVAGVTGLSDFKPTAAFSTSGKGTAFTPADFYSTFNMTPVLNGTGAFPVAYTGTGHVVAVAENSIINSESFDSFRNNMVGSYGTGTRALKLYDGVPASSCEAAGRTGRIGEQQALADSEWALAGAPGAQVVLVSCGDSAIKTGAEAAAELVIDHPMISGTRVDSLSVGVNVCEAGRSASDIANWKNYLLAAASEGVSVFTPTDDAATCDLGLIKAPVTVATPEAPPSTSISFTGLKATYCDVDGRACNGHSAVGASVSSAARAGVQAVLNQVNGSAIGFSGFSPLSSGQSGTPDVSATAGASSKVKPYNPIIGRAAGNPIEKGSNVTVVWPTPAAVPYGTALTSVQLDAQAISSTYVPVIYTINGIATAPANPGGGFDGGGSYYDDNYFGSNIQVNGLTYYFGPNNALNAFSGGTILLPLAPAGVSYTSITLIGAMVNNEASPTHNIVINYPLTTQTFTQTFSDWAYPKGWPNEVVAKCAAYRVTNGVESQCTSCMFAYTFPLSPGAVSITLPADRDIAFVAADVYGAPIAGTFTYTPAAGTIEPVGNYTLSTTFVPDDTTDYNSGSGSVSLNVFPAIPTITWLPNPEASIAYGTALSATQLDAYATAVTGYTPVPLGGYVNVIGYFSDGYKPQNAAYGFASNSDAYSANLLGSIVYYNGIGFPLGGANLLSAASNVVTIPVGVPATTDNPGQAFNYLYVLTAGSNSGGSPAASGNLVVTYGDGSTSTFALAPSSFAKSVNQPGETIVSTMSYVDNNSGGNTTAGYPNFYLYGYTLTLNSSKTVASITTPGGGIVIFGLALGTTSEALINPLPGIFAYNPGTGTVLSIGTHTLSTTFTPQDAADYVTTTATNTITVIGQVSDSITLAATSSAGSTSAGVTTVNLQATVTPSQANGAFNGFVTFTDTTTGGYVTAVINATTGIATTTITTTTTMTGGNVSAGLDNFTASYGGGTNYAAVGPSNTVPVYFSGLLFTTDLTHDFSICYTNNGTGSIVGCGQVTTGSGDSGGTLDGAPTTCGGSYTTLGYNCTAPYGVVLYNFNSTAITPTLTFTNTAAGSFNYATNCPASLAAYASCNYYFYYSPPFGDGSSTTVGKYETGSWKIAPSTGITGVGDKAFDRSGATVFPATLSGWALLNPGSLSVTPSGGTFSFGTLATGGTSAVETVIVYNPNLTAVSYTATVPASPYIVNNTCKTPLAAGASCNIYVSLESSTVNTYTGTLTVTPSGGSAITEGFTGKVIANTGISLTTNDHAFGNVNDGSSVTFGLNVTNKSTTTVANLSVTPGSGTGYTMLNGCGATLAVGKSCQIAVTFAPTSPGASNYSFVISSSNLNITPGGSVTAPYTDTVSFSGTGVTSTNEFTASSVVKKWGGVPKGTSGGNYGVQLVNSTSSPVTFSALGPINGSSEFSLVASSCGTTLAVNASCELIFGFNPSSSGPVTATYALTSNATLYSGGVVISPAQISLSGTGQ
jgi:hypothetical protein